jgi:AraC family transcriptional regulator, regulatory protein of adaptative response / methylated-DNA-[protein]-cysteine methyltransferase
MNSVAPSTSLTHDPSSTRPLPSRPEMERAFLNSDQGYDGIFYTAVKSTGIFCRPSCPAKTPLLENVEFMGTVKMALFAGYRPCLRCRPLELDGPGPEWVRRLLAALEKSPDQRFADSDLRSMGIDPARARRYFTNTFGLSFHAYCRGRRLAKALQVIRNGGSLDDAVFESGYESHSGFRESFRKIFGHPPGQSGTLDYIQLAWINTPLGPMIAGATVAGICLLEFTDRRMLEKELELLRRRLKKPLLPGETEHHRQLRAELKDYFSAARKEFTVAFVRVGSEFESRVWNELLRIPHGQVRSYEDIARRIGQPRAVRAVGRANGMNRIAILIPCHRAISKNGDFGGYGGGLWRKRLLLHLERTAESLTSV